MASARAHTPQLPTTPIKSPAMYLSRSNGSSSRSLPLAATTTKLNITSTAPSPADESAKGEQSKQKSSSEQDTKSDDQKISGGEKSDVKSPQRTSTVEKDSSTKAKDKPLPESEPKRDSAGWLNWFSKTGDAMSGDSVVQKPVQEPEHIDSAAKDPPSSTSTELPKDTTPSPSQRRNSDPSPVSPKAQQEQPPRSWLSLWGNVTTQSQNSKCASATGVATNGFDELNDTTSKAQPDASKTDPISTPRPTPGPSETAKPYGWAFWSTDQSKDEGGKMRSGSIVGKLAKADSPTQSKPENAIVDESRGVPNKVGKRQRPQSMDVKNAKSKGTEDATKQTGKPESSVEAPRRQSLAEASLKARTLPDNLLLPAFKRTYSPLERPGIIQQFSRLLQLGSHTEFRHLHIAQSPHRVKRALAIGVHGYFPAPLIRSVLGQPTGTSIRFANGAAGAIQKWTHDQGYSCEIEKVALEGEGKIAERIDLLWKLMLNWIEKIRKADLVMIACHSQGVPVAMMLVSKLIAMGCVNAAKIGVCAMAGVNLGPFADYKSRWISGSAGELFDFARPDSQVSKDYEAALDVALRFGVKIVYVGSIDDQLVSLDSSTFGSLNHPNIYRAVFVDGRVHAPDFLTHLVGFALKLRNLGISDHGLIRELSTPLAGSLYSGEGHSRIYDDEAVYYLAVEHALETTSLGSMAPQFQRDGSVLTAQNPYILPFVMRGLLEEEYVRTELEGEITELIKQFDDWKPSSKVLKDVKFRLEGVRSKL